MVVVFQTRQETPGRPLALLSFTQLRSHTIPHYSLGAKLSSTPKKNGAEEGS